jgi:hypothetical protein
MDVSTTAALAKQSRYAAAQAQLKNLAPYNAKKSGVLRYKAMKKADTGSLDEKEKH